MADWGAISPDDPDLLIRVNSVDEALEALKQNLEPHLASEEEDQLAPALSKTNR
jgi:predicted RNase H-like HicB family nuclease